MKGSVGFMKVLMMVLLSIFLSSSAFAKSECKKEYGSSINKLTLATGSPGELGLIEVLATEFNEKYDVSICWKKAGSGKSLELLKAKEADVIMVHAPVGEKKAVEEGWAIRRSLLGSNEFYIVGPKNDPANIAKAKSASDAYARIAQSKTNFLSRGDNSGTNKKELAIWKKADITPEGDWYIITKDFMLASLIKANEVNGYFMTDSSTWVAGKKNLDNLKVLFRGDPMLINVYHGLCQPVGATKNQSHASKFIDFLASDTAQIIIRNYGKKQYGEAMYNDAEYAKKYDH